MITTVGLQKLKLEDNHIEIEHNFNFLASNICDDADYEKEIRRRVAMGCSTMIKLAKIMKDDDISVDKKKQNWFIPLCFR